MKSYIRKKSTTAILVAACILMSSSPFSSVKAGNKIDRIELHDAKAPRLSTNLVGEKDNCVIIRIAMSQEKEQRSYLRIYDDKGEMLFEEMVFAKSEAKLIKVSPDELHTLRIVYSSAGMEAMKLLAINAVTKFSVSEIAKLK